MLARLLGFLGAIAVLVLGFFFLAAALVAGAVLAAVFVARVWWLSRKARKSADDQVITTDYTVIEREALPQQPRLPHEPPLESEREPPPPNWKP